MLRLKMSVLLLRQPRTTGKLLSHDSFNGYISHDGNRGDKISCAFVVTGPNLASQDLLFEQLEESLLASPANKFVRLRSADATNMKATLKKIIQDITCKASDEEDGQLMIGKSVSLPFSPLFPCQVRAFF